MSRFSIIILAFAVLALGAVLAVPDEAIAGPDVVVSAGIADTASETHHRFCKAVVGCSQCSGSSISVEPTLPDDQSVDTPDQSAPEYSRKGKRTCPSKTGLSDSGHEKPAFGSKAGYLPRTYWKSDGQSRVSPFRPPITIS